MEKNHYAVKVNYPKSYEVEYYLVEAASKLEAMEEIRNNQVIQLPGDEIEMAAYKVEKDGNVYFIGSIYLKEYMK